MEKIKFLQNVLEELVSKYASVKAANQELETIAIIDKTNNHFQIVSMGWDNHRFTFNPLLHFDIINEKIWVQVNWTDIELEDFFTEKGVEKNDIVIGFLPKYAREHSGFAVA
jgi:XisI protein